MRFKLRHAERACYNHGVEKPVLSRDLDIGDWERINDIFVRFREEFSMWAHPNLWELLAFVQYEGIDLPIVREAEPLVKALKCVSLYGARWCMIAVGNEWRVGLDHDDFQQPIDLTKYHNKQLESTLSKKWQRRLLKRDLCE